MTPKPNDSSEPVADVGGRGIGVQRRTDRSERECSSGRGEADRCRQCPYRPGRRTPLSLSTDFLGCRRVRASTSRHPSRGTRVAGMLPLLLALLLGVFRNAAHASNLCTDPSEAVKYRRIAMSPDGSRCCDKYKLEGIDTACHYHFYTRSEALSCLANKHVIIFGGSVQFGMAMNLMKLLRPAESYPVKPDTFMNCPDCGLLQSTALASLWDLVLDGDGDIVSLQTMEYAELEGFNEGSAIPYLDEFLANVQSSTGGGATPGGWDGVRITYANVRYYDDVVKVAKYILNAYNGNGGGDSTSDRYEPVLWLGIRGWWYDFCSKEYIDSDTDFCMRDDLRYQPRSTIFAKAAADAKSMVSDIKSKLPSVTSVIMDGDEYVPDYEWNIQAVENAIAQVPQGSRNPFVFIRNDGSAYGGGAQEEDLWQRSHPNNKNYQLRMARALTFACEGSGVVGWQAESATDETIQFLTGGCVEDKAGVIDSTWANHFYQPCQWNSQLSGVPASTTTTTKSASSSGGGNGSNSGTSTATTKKPSSSGSVGVGGRGGLPPMKYDVPRSWNTDAVSFLLSTHSTASSLDGNGESNFVPNGPLSWRKFQRLIATLSTLIALFSIMRLVKGLVKGRKGKKGSAEPLYAVGQSFTRMTCRERIGGSWKKFDDALESALDQLCCVMKKKEAPEKVGMAGDDPDIVVAGQDRAVVAAAGIGVAWAVSQPPTIMQSPSSSEGGDRRRRTTYASTPPSVASPANSFSVAAFESPPTHLAKVRECSRGLRPIQVEELAKAADESNEISVEDPSIGMYDESSVSDSGLSCEGVGPNGECNQFGNNDTINIEFDSLDFGNNRHSFEGIMILNGTNSFPASKATQSRDVFRARSAPNKPKCARSNDASKTTCHLTGSPVHIVDTPRTLTGRSDDTFEDEPPREESAHAPTPPWLEKRTTLYEVSDASSKRRQVSSTPYDDKNYADPDAGGNLPDEEIKSSPAGASANATLEKRKNYLGVQNVFGIPEPGGKRAPALGFARFVASVHIVAGHIVRKPGQQMIPNWATNQYGYTWVPWFMMLSGFILSFARLRSRNPDKLDMWYLFTAKRVKSIYPLYLTGLLTWAAVDAYLTQTRFSLGTPFETVASLLLIQAWIPSITEHVVQPHCWFLSCIVPYWMLHNFMYAKSKKWSTKVICVVLAVLTVLPWIAIVIVPAALGNLYWFNAHDYYGTGTAVDTLVVMLKYHPLCYWHTYLYGVLCAHLCVRFKDKPPFLLKFGSSWGYAGLFIIFAISPWARFPADELSFRLGVLSPFQGAGLIGLTLGLDPVAQIFGVPILACLGELSYPQYVFQFIAFVFFADATNPFGYWAFLMALSIIGYVWIQNPLKDWNVKRKTTYVYSSLAMVALPGVLVALLLLYVGVPKRNDMDSLPDKVKYSSTAQDMRLNFETFSDARRLRKGGLPRIHPDAPADAHVNFINPSLLYVESDDSFLLTARRHLFVSTTEKGPFDVPVIDGRLGTDDVADWKTTTTWYSDIVVGGAGWDDRRKRDGFFISTLKTLAIDEPSCNTTYGFTRANRTLSVLVRLGPEDPRLIRHADGELGVTFNHLPIAQEQDSEVRVDKVCTEESVMYSLDLAGSDEQLLYGRGMAGGYDLAAEGSTMQPIDDPLFIWDIDRVPTVKEKNWIGVVHPEKGTYFIKNLYPYSICHLAVDTGVCEYVSAPSNPVMKSLYQNGYKVHGGSNAIFLDQGVLLSEEESASGPKYLAAIHAIDEHGRYLNYLVELEGESPFQIVRVSAPLPLLEAPALDGSTSRPLAFVSGLTVVNRRGGTDNDAYSRFFVSYGSSNMESRVLELSGADVAYLFGAEEVSVVVPSSPGSSNDNWGAQGNKEDFLDYMEWSNSPPGGLNPDQVPMFVSLGFDDNGIAGLQDDVSGTGGVTWAADFFRSLRNPDGRGNPGTYDGTPARVSFFATTSYIDKWFKESPATVKKSWRTAYEDGHEFGSHMHLHVDGFNFTETQWKDEIVQSVDLISRPFDAEESVGDPEKEKGIGIPASELVGFRAPYLSYNAELYSSLEELGFLYDCSIAEGWQGDEDGTNFAWPYTLDNGSKGHDYALSNGFPGKVPLGSYKGLWEIPAYAIIIPPDEVAERYGIESGLRDRIKKLMPWFGVEDGKLTGFDFNLWVEAKVSKEEFLATLKYTLDMRLQGNRAPFTLGVHTDYYSSEWYFEAEANAKVKERQEAIEEFITYALSLPEVRVVPHQAILDWIRNPNREVL